MEDQINSKTHCPTCGSEVTIGHGDGNSHFYIPKVVLDKEKLADFFEEYDKLYTEEEVINFIKKFEGTNITTNEDPEFMDWFNENKKSKKL